ncbi:MAG: MBL fold metallo-hydrolase [Tannerellaceae bacterium]|jgi:L-ascorbate metabolism protein UlaG (beta-lactamase superfamily)|nr:MBL fold metallo-hydrolase [Tannerellaceae bacterium]
MMKLIYIYHSCYAIEAEGFAVIFDYYHDSGNLPREGYVHDKLLRCSKPLYVLASHVHPDHFNREILEWKSSNIIRILSTDILDSDRAKASDGIFLQKGDIWQDERLKIQAMGSTDVGVSYIIYIGNKTIFHAGDLNNWHWKDESTDQEVQEAESAYLAELDGLAAVSDSIDLAMFPIDPHIGSDYMRGAEQFVERIHTRVMAPMHFEPRYDKAAAFAPIAARHNCRLLSVSRKGEEFNDIL